MRKWHNVFNSVYPLTRIDNFLLKWLMFVTPTSLLITCVCVYYKPTPESLLLLIPLPFLNNFFVWGVKLSQWGKENKKLEILDGYIKLKYPEIWEKADLHPWWDLAGDADSDNYSFRRRQLRLRKFLCEESFSVDEEIRKAKEETFLAEFLLIWPFILMIVNFGLGLGLGLIFSQSLAFRHG